MNKRYIAEDGRILLVSNVRVNKICNSIGRVGYSSFLFNKDSKEFTPFTALIIRKNREDAQSDLDHYAKKKELQVLE